MLLKSSPKHSFTSSSSMEDRGKRDNATKGVQSSAHKCIQHKAAK